MLRPVPARRILVGAPATLSWQWLDAVERLDLLTVAWTAGEVTHRELVEVVGGFYFSAAQARGSDPSLQSTTAYPNAAILERRTAVEWQCELICRVAWVPRFRRAVLDGSGRPALVLPEHEIRTVRSISVDGVSIDPAAVLVGAGLGDPAAGLLTRTGGGVWPPGRGNVTVDFEHGTDRPPADLRDAALVHLRHMLNRPTAGLPDRATQFQAVDGGTVLLATPGRYGYDTGIPEVDAVYQRYARDDPGFG